MTVKGAEHKARKRSRILIALFIVAEISLAHGSVFVLDVLGYKGSWVPVQHHGPYRGSTAGHYSTGFESLIIFLAVNGLAIFLYGKYARSKSQPKKISHSEDYEFQGSLDWSQVESREDWLRRYNEERTKAKKDS